MNPIIQEDLERIVKTPLPWERFSGTTVLVTGAAGFIPAYMVETLIYLNRFVLAKPCHIIGLVRNKIRATQRFKDYDTYELDLRTCNIGWQDPDIYSDFTIHAASQASPIYYKTDPVGTLLPNTVGTSQLLELSRLSNSKGFLYFSSGEVYGHVAHPLTPVREDTIGCVDQLNLRSCYSESKRMGEQMCVAWASQHGVPTRIVRPWHTYGPGMRFDDGRVFADFTRDIVNGGPIILNSDGSASRSFCYLADATIAFFTALLLGQDAAAYNVANPAAEVTIYDLALRLGAEFNRQVDWRGRPSDNYMPSPNPGIRADIAKIRALGWEPTTGIEDGFRRTVESYQ